MNDRRVPVLSRGFGALGALLAGAAVALSAYAAHGVDGMAQTNLQLAALFGFGHGVALVALARGLRGRLALASLGLLLVGTLLFSGALFLKYGLGFPSAAAAPFGGGLLILGWLGYAIATLRG